MVNTKFLCFSLLTISLLTGCVTTTLQTNVTMTQTIFLEPVAKNKKTIFLNIKNTSGKNINFEKQLQNLLKNKDYIVVDNPQEANFILNTNVLYCDKKQENNATTGVGSGVVIGAGVGAYNSTGVGGALITSGAFGLVGGIIGKLTEDTTYQIQVDINIKQITNEKVLNSNTTNQNQAEIVDKKRNGFLNSLAGEVKGEKIANLKSNLDTSNKQVYEGNYIEKSTTMIAEATKLNLKLEEALPILEDKIAKQIVALF